MQQYESRSSLLDLPVLGGDDDHLATGVAPSLAASFDAAEVADIGIFVSPRPQPAQAKPRLPMLDDEEPVTHGHPLMWDEDEDEDEDDDDLLGDDEDDLEFDDDEEGLDEDEDDIGDADDEEFDFDDEDEDEEEEDEE